jgi:DNA-binding MarR family transcriptional regulator
MSSPITPELTHEFLSSARVFAKAVRDVFEAAILQEVAGDKLTFVQLKLLYLVAQADSVTIGDAAAFLGVTSPAASKSVEKLVRRRLLRRSDIQGDRRTSQLSLTEASRRLLEAYEAARNQRAAEVFAQYLPEELQHTSELLDRLAAGIARQRPDQSAHEDELCLQCEIYFRQRCRFKEFGARHCFYQLHKSDQPDPPSVPTGSSELEAASDFGQSKEG